MCRWLAYCGEPIFMDTLVYDPEHSLIEQSMEATKAVTRVNADGFGLGWYTHRKTPGLFKEVLPAWGDENLASLTHHIQSHRFMAHVRSSTGTQVSKTNCHPFSIENWLFIHNGQIGEFNQVKFALERLLPETLYLQRFGTTDSELIFLLMVHFGLKHSPVTAIRRTIEVINHIRHDKGIATPFKASICVSDGEAFWAVRYSSDEQPPTVFVSSIEGNITLASEPLTRERKWKAIPPQSIAHVTDGEVSYFSVSSVDESLH